MLHSMRILQPGCPGVCDLSRVCAGSAHTRCQRSGVRSPKLRGEPFGGVVAAGQVTSMPPMRYGSKPILSGMSLTRLTRNELTLLLTLRLQRGSTRVGSAGQVRNGLPVRDESKLILSIMSLTRFTRNKPPAEETRNSKAQSPSKSKSRNPNHKEGRAPERVSLTFWVAIQLLKNDGDFALLHASPDSYSCGVPGVGEGQCRGSKGAALFAGTSRFCKNVLASLVLLFRKAQGWILGGVTDGRPRSAQQA